MRTRSFSWDLKEAMKKYPFEPKALVKDAIYEVGKTYWCSYWQKWYKVLDTNYDYTYAFPQLVYVKIQWDDGKTAIHSTSLDTERDWELIWQPN